MSGIFLSIFELSTSAIWLILVILAVRPFLRNIPQWGIVLLWGLVGLRLMVPFSIESRFSLIPGAETAGDVPIIEFAELPAAGQVQVSANVDILPLFSALWLLGVIFLVGYFAIRYWRILKKLDTAVLLRENIYLSEWISAPIVIGLLKPKIVVPFSVDENSMKHIIAHEKAHIRRGDHWWKLLAYGVLTLHWFNPFVWIAYMLLGRDIELACDESVIRALDSRGRADYSQALVMCSARNASTTVYLLGFGGIGVKTRVKSVMNYRKSTASGYILTVAVMMLLAACFLTDPIVEQPQEDMFSDSGQLQLQEAVTEPTCNPMLTEPQEEALLAELEKLKRQLSSYQEYLARDRDAFLNAKVGKTGQDTMFGLRNSIAFYGRMIDELTNSIIELEEDLCELDQGGKYA